MAFTLHEHPDPETMDHAIATELADACTQARDAGHVPLLALAGGGTPLPAYRRLAALLGDTRMQAVPGDERCVPHDHAACNLRVLRATFANAPGVECLAITCQDGDPNRSLELARARLASLPAFDAAVLGMGTDAHFASLFPHSAGLAAGLDPASLEDAIALVPATLPPEAPYARISLTLSRLLRSRRLMLAIRGEAKRDVLQSAAAPGVDPFACPVAALLQAAPALHVHWSP